MTEEQVISTLTSQIRDAKMYPIFFGSALTGIGVAELLTGVAAFFPVNTRSEDAPVSAVVFKIEKEASGEKIAYVRVFSGSIHVRAYVSVSRKTNEREVEIRTDKVKKLPVFWRGKTIQSPKVGAGEFCKVWGLKDVRFELSAPAHAISKAMFRLSALKAVFEKPILRGDTFLLTGTLPVATTEEFKRSLHSFTEGEGVFLTKPSGFRKIENAFPTRKRADYNPLNRKDYMLHVLHAY